MRRLILSLLLLAAATPVHAQGNATTTEGMATTPADIARGNRAFALDLYRQTARVPDETGQVPDNMVLSPLGIAAAFGPAIAGAQGETRTVLQRLLRFPVAGAGLHPAFADLLNGLRREGEAGTISIANAAWVSNRLQVHPAYADLIRASYRATIAPADFGDRAATANAVNAWADRETRGRIREVIGPPNIDPDGRLILANAVYFLSDWAAPFPRGTQTAPFTLGSGRQVQMPIMEQRRRFRHYRGNGFGALDLPYRSDGLMMTVLLPDRPGGLAALERSLTPALLDRVTQALDRADPADVLVRLPRMTLEANRSLLNPLQAMGMRMRDGGLIPLTGVGVSTQPPLIRGVIHATFLRVDEQGTEAAAVTVLGDIIVVSGRRRIPDPIRFEADHPFLFLIRDRASGTILFIGRLRTPPGG